jgi:hypothetical protein
VGLVLAVALVPASANVAVMAVQRAHGTPHARYAEELADRVATSPPDDAPLVVEGVAAGEAEHRRMLELRVRNRSDRAITGFAWRWEWDASGCPDMTTIVAAPGAYGSASSGADARHAPAVEPGQTVTITIPAEKVRDLLRTTRKRCPHGRTVKFMPTSVLFADGSRWEPPRATPSN